MYAIIAWSFPIQYFLMCYSERFQVYFSLRFIFEFFFRAICPFGTSAVFFWFPYFTPELFYFLWIRFSLSCAFFIYYLNFFSLVWNILFNCITWLCPAIFESPFFCQYFLFILFFLLFPVFSEAGVPNLSGPFQATTVGVSVTLNKFYF